MQQQVAPQGAAEEAGLAAVALADGKAAALAAAGGGGLLLLAVVVVKTPVRTPCYSPLTGSTRVGCGSGRGLWSCASLLL